MPCLLDLHSTGSFRMSRFRKHRGFAALPITNGFSISPDIKPHRNTVNISLHSFPPKLFSPFRHSDLFGSARKNSPVSSPFAMFSVSYPWIMVGSLAIQSSMVSLFTLLDSPQSSHYLMSFAKTLQPSVRCFEFSLPQFLNDVFSIFLYHGT